MKTINLTSEQAKSLHSTADETMKKLLEINFPELKDAVGWFINIEGGIKKLCLDSYLYETLIKVSYATEKQALSALAMAKLSHLMAETGDCDGIDWNDAGYKSVIKRMGDSCCKCWDFKTYHFLAFKTESIRDDFFIKHIDLINQYHQI